MPKVSVIIPCFNQGVFIEEAVNAVLEQSFSDWEIIIVNDGSTDPHTNDFLKHYSPSKTSIYFTENKGVSAARNFGISKSSGVYILPVDADDRIHRDYLKAGVDILDQNPLVKMVCCNAEHFGGDNFIQILPRYEKRKLLQQNLFFNSSMFRRDAFIAAGMYDETFLTGWEDWDLYLRLINCDKEIYHIDETYFFHRLTSGSRNDALKAKKLEKVEQQLYLKYIDKYLEEYANPISLIRHYEHMLCEQQQYENYKNALQNSLSYRLGSFALYPVKALGNFLKGNRT